MGDQCENEAPVHGTTVYAKPIAKPGCKARGEEACGDVNEGIKGGRAKHAVTFFFNTYITGNSEDNKNDNNKSNERGKPNWT